MVVEVRHVLGQYRHEMAAVDDQDPSAPTDGKPAPLDRGGDSLTLQRRSGREQIICQATETSGLGLGEHPCQDRLAYAV